MQTRRLKFHTLTGALSESCTIAVGVIDGEIASISNAMVRHLFATGCCVFGSRANCLLMKLKKIAILDQRERTAHLPQS